MFVCRLSLKLGTEVSGVGVGEVIRWEGVCGVDSTKIDSVDPIRMSIYNYSKGLDID